MLLTRKLKKIIGDLRGAEKEIFENVEDRTGYNQNEWAAHMLKIFEIYGDDID